MAKLIKITLRHQPEELFARAKEAAGSYGLRFTGDINRGVVSGLGIEGGYELQENILTLTINRKPMIVPWSTIEQKVRHFIG